VTWTEVICTALTPTNTKWCWICKIHTFKNAFNTQFFSLKNRGFTPMLRPDFRGWLLFGLPGILILGECRIGNPPAAAYIRWTVLSPFPAIVSRFGVLSWKKPCSGFFHLYPIKWKLYTIQCRLKSHLHTESHEMTHVVSGIVMKSQKQHDVNQYWQGKSVFGKFISNIFVPSKTSRIQPSVPTSWWDWRSIAKLQSPNACVAYGR